MHKKNRLHAFNFLDPSSWLRNSIYVHVHVRVHVRVHIHVHVHVYVHVHVHINRYNHFTWAQTRFKLFPSAFKKRHYCTLKVAMHTTVHIQHFCNTVVPTRGIYLKN
jgi:hypothetical protein